MFTGERKPEREFEDRRRTERDRKGKKRQRNLEKTKVSPERKKYVKHLCFLAVCTPRTYRKDIGR